MLRKKNIIYALIGAISLALLTTILATISMQSQHAKANGQAENVLRKGSPTGNEGNSQRTAKELDDAATPIVDLNSTDVGDEERQHQNQRHNHGGLELAETPGTSVEVTVDSEFSMPDFPFKISDLVIEGTVTDSNAFLSADKTGVYSEYTVAISDLIKSSASSTVHKHESITAERFGGRVRFPSGQIIRYKGSGQGSPAKNTKYIFFLKKVNQDSYLILTAYELRGNKAFALDGSRVNLGKGNWAFDKHNDQEVTSFKKDLDKALKGDSNETYKVY